MGDIVDVSYPLCAQAADLLIPVSSSVMAFQVRHNPLTHIKEIGFAASKDPIVPVFKLTIGRSTHLEVALEERRSRVQTQLTTYEDGEEWQRYWVTWNRGHVCVGNGQDTQPYMKVSAEKLINVKLQDIKYVMIQADRDAWRFLLRPIPPELKGRTGTDLRWESVRDGALPADAVIGGHEEEPLYVVRAQHERSVTPGAMKRSTGLAYIPWGGNANEKVDFEVLVGRKFSWKCAANGSVPEDAFPAGHTEDHHTDLLFLGRTHVDGHLILGKVQPSHNVIYIPYNGQEVARNEYEVLVAPPAVDPRVIVRHVISQSPGWIRGNDRQPRNIEIFGHNRFALEPPDHWDE